VHRPLVAPALERHGQVEGSTPAGLADARVHRCEPALICGLRFGILLSGKLEDHGRGMIWGLGGCRIVFRPDAHKDSEVSRGLARHRSSLGIISL
jgi:hypothetical protein